MIKLDKVSKKFGTGVFGLSEVTLEVEKGEFVFLVGTTGSGKTTLLRLIIRDTLPTSGSVSVQNIDLAKVNGGKLSNLRKMIGVIFQDLKLLPDRTIFENVILPLEISGGKSNDSRIKVEDVLRQVGLIDHKDKFPIQLSGGELQRAAIARALILSPEILLADEPTGNLDTATSWEIVKILSDINSKGTTIIMATHNADIIKTLHKRVVQLEKGKIIKDEKKHAGSHHKEEKNEDEKAEEEIIKSEKIEKEEKTEGEKDK